MGYTHWKFRSSQKWKFCEWLILTIPQTKFEKDSWKLKFVLLERIPSDCKFVQGAFEEVYWGSCKLYTAHPTWKYSQETTLDAVLLQDCEWKQVLVINASMCQIYESYKGLRKSLLSLLWPGAAGNVFFKKIQDSSEDKESDNLTKCKAPKVLGDSIWKHVCHNHHCYTIFKHNSEMTDLDKYICLRQSPRLSFPGISLCHFRRYHCVTSDSCHLFHSPLHLAAVGLVTPFCPCPDYHVVPFQSQTQSQTQPDTVGLGPNARPPVPKLPQQQVHLVHVATPLAISWVCVCWSELSELERAALEV